ncbi:aminoacyl-tRNA hydrolase [Methylocystaceae bacterium]|nr:aminoacyl-tRNA hydrolase [Methylocystaceae bacterium]
MIHIIRNIFIDDAEISYEFLRSSGPGGQNVQKVETCVRLRFNAKDCQNLSFEISQKLLRLAGRKATKEGVILIEAQRYRTQQRNREDALERLKNLIIKAAEPPSPPRIKTKPTYGAKLRRLEGKKLRSTVKNLRSRPSQE